MKRQRKRRIKEVGGGEALEKESKKARRQRITNKKKYCFGRVWGGN